MDRHKSGIPSIRRGPAHVEDQDRYQGDRFPHDGNRSYRYERPGYNDGPVYESVRSGGRNSLVWGLTLLLMTGWSLLAWFGYMVADPILNWLGATASGLIEGGQGMAEAIGGKPAGEALKAVDAGGLAAQLLNLVKVVAKPAIVVIWIIGLAVLAVLPLLVSKLPGLLRRFR